MFLLVVCAAWFVSLSLFSCACANVCVVLFFESLCVGFCIFVFVCVCALLSVCVCLCVRPCVCVCLLVCLFVFVYVCAFACA